MGAQPLITNAQRRARLAARHRLVPRSRTNDIAAITESVVALHSSDPATVYLSAMARMRNPSVQAISAALYDDRTVVRHHAMRRTLWVFTPQFARHAHAVCTAPLALREWKGLAALVEASEVAASGAEWVAAARADTLRALERLGEVTARRLGREVPALNEKLHLAVGKSYAASQGAHTRLLLNLGFDGAIVRTRPSSSWITSEYNWSLADKWIPGGLLGTPSDEAAAGVLRAYLAQFGPATLADIQWWAGWTAGLTKQTLAAVNAVEVWLDEGTGWVLPDDADLHNDGHVESVDEPWVAFLPGLDSTTMGWKQRSWYLGDLGAFGSSVFDRNGNGGPTVWVDGQVVGGWAQRKSGEVVYELLTEVPKSRHKAITAEAERVRQLIGNERVAARFPAPMQKTLLG
jgi:hypothetical protein